MSVAERRRQDVESSLNNLSLHPTSHKPRKPVPKQQASTIADSWEDEELSSSSDTEPSPRPYNSDFPSAPPPTPISPTSNSARGGLSHFENPYSPGAPLSPGNIYSPGRERDGMGGMSPMRGHFRPEKTTAVAGRMIAGALGVRTPKKTEEQRHYEKAVKEKEIRRRDKERAGQRTEAESAEKAKAAIWDD